MADETIEVEFVAKTQDAVERAKEFQAQINALKEQIRQVSAVSNTSFKEAAEGIRRSMEFIKTVQGKSVGEFVQVKDREAASQFGKAMTRALQDVQKESKGAEGAAKNLDKELRQKPKDAKAVENAFSSLGNVAKYVFGTILGLSAIQIFNTLRSAFTDLIRSGVEFSNAIYRLGASTRALQRSGLDITIADTIEQVRKLREQYSFFSEKEAIQGVASIQLLTRSFGFTKEQMEQATQAAVTLSTVTGKDFAETSRELALFLSSGYAESMQRAGLAVNRLRVAEEAQRNGLDKGYNALLEQERAANGLSLVLRELAPISEEVRKYQESLAGQIDTTTAEIEDQTNKLALQLAPLQLAWLKLKNTVLEAYLGITEIFSQFGLSIRQTFVTPFVAAINTIALAFQKLKEGAPLSMEEFRSAMVDEANKINDELEKVWADFSPNTASMEGAGEDLAAALAKGMGDVSSAEMEEKISDIMGDAIDAAKEANQAIQEAQQDLLSDVGTIDDSSLGNITDAWNQFFSNNKDLTVDELEAQQDIWEGFFGEFGDITDDGLNKAWDIWRDYYDKLSDIDQGEQQDILDAQRDLANDLADLNRDTQQKLEDAARKYREGELKAERDYQEKLRRLREEYLFDLEDALRERDALQVIRLMRRYNLDKEQLAREKDLEAQDRAEKYRQEIEDIKRQAARKAEELKLENQRRIEEIRMQAQREREEAAIERDQAMQELKEDMEREREERRLKYEQELEDIRQRFIDELAEIILGLTNELGASEELTAKINEVFKNVFGADGTIADTYKEFSTTLGNITDEISAATAQVLADLAVLQAAQAAAGIASSTTFNPSTLSPIQQVNQPSIPQFATGGTLLANKPTLAMFGEVPELVQFTPLSKLGSQPAVPTAGGSMTRVYIKLAPGLVGEIVDQSLDSVARIMVER